MARRRTVLLGAMAALLARPAMAAGLSGRRIIVVGAGFAGLAAARALTAEGAEVTVIEARDRIGGRVWTSRLWPDLPVDMGASWIHGTRGNPLSALADAAGLARVATDYDSAAAFAGGAEAEDPAEPWDMIEAAQAQATPGQSLRDAVIATPDWTDLSDAERTSLRLAIHRAVEQEYGGDWSALSALHFDAGRAFGGPDVLFPGGYGALAAHAARGLDIRLGQRVTAITARKVGVTLTLADGGTLTADHAVLTLPLGVLQSGAVRFDPPLSPERQAAIAALGMGLLNKCWLRFDAPPPVPPVDWIERTDSALWSEWVNLGPATGAPLLLGFNAADTADRVEALDDRATLASAREALRAMFGSAFPDPVAAQISRWRADPLSLGAYSYLAAGATPAHRAALSGPDWENRIAFAGEAASTDHAATVHGAWLSGLSVPGMLA